ncbi:GDSL esterase/lipase At2g23540-like [Camellia sinensis]|uniref:GDSL esterase/lipase At2g23540-like n=1 Tax=Camellia sinensis TaxID=4442 RepID=UPI0010366720|nr:GDSL esterase/lipase At2g23540-like [Camellia sinensis]
MESTVKGHWSNLPHRVVSSTLSSRWTSAGMPYSSRNTANAPGVLTRKRPRKYEYQIKNNEEIRRTYRFGGENRIHKRRNTPERQQQCLIHQMNAVMWARIVFGRGGYTRLYKLDARKFIVGNVGPIGCIPYRKTINQLNEDECVELPNKLALQYNARLKDLLAELNDNLPGATFVHANVYDLVMELIKNYATYASRACCGNGGQFAGIVPCGPQSSMCSDRDKHVFWYPYHPSDAANVIIAKQLIGGDHKYVSLMNIRQLRDL